MRSKKGKILITGANGLLGQKLVKLISEDDNFELIPSGLGESRLPISWGVEKWEKLDICVESQVMAIFEKLKPDFVIHTAAMTNVDQCEEYKEECKELNIQAVLNLVKACEKFGSHLIHLSTDFIFDGNEGPYHEEAKANPVNFYGWTKLEAENIILNSGIDSAIVRTVLVYGIANDMSRSNIILWVKDALEKGKQINLVNDQVRTPTLAEDLAEGCFLIVKHGAKGVYNISGKDVLTPYQMALATAEFFNLDKSLILESDSSKFKQKAKRPMKTGFYIDKAKKDLGYNPKSFMDGIGILAKQIKLADS
ncbi:SDR family oxidoreductase [Belliella sp. DSM 111904]|uniref:dTDP-4-dehydrorhamnose reductase n=1 Tax=Belliella filtrata TaxID=2923435 RepID=A0ABS9V4G1_9BACT|nr:SDR family oxidoreductase [Belliella filtrata]MCH7411290.1 SDR family oxidoreductase [Belliella filtrata]